MKYSDNKLLTMIESYFNSLLEIESLNLDEELNIVYHINSTINIKNILYEIIIKFVDKSKFYGINYQLVHDLDIDDNLKKQLFFKLFDYENLIIMNKLIVTDFIQMIKTSKLSVNEAIQILKLLQEHQELNTTSGERLKLAYFLIKSYSLQLYELNIYIAYFFMNLQTDHFPDLDDDQFIYIIKQFIMNYHNITHEINDDNNSIKYQIFDYVYMYKNNSLFEHFNEAMQYYMKLTQNEINAYYALKEIKG